MKKKEIKEKIEQADTRLTREKATVYDNIINSIFEVSDTERLHFYDTVFLYIFYGISPDFATFSDKKQGQIRIIFSLLKKQRKGYESTLKLDSYDKTTPKAPPKAPPKATPEATPNQDISIKTKDKDLIIKTQDEDEDEDEDEDCSPSSSSSVFIDNFLKCYKAKGLQGFFDETLTPNQRNRIIELSSKIDDFAGKFWEEVNASDWLQTQDFGKVLNLAEKVIDGEYRNHRSPSVATLNGSSVKYGSIPTSNPFGPFDDQTMRIGWAALNETEQKEYLDTHGGRLPWEQNETQERIIKEFENFTESNPFINKENKYAKLKELQDRYSVRIENTTFEKLGMVLNPTNRKWIFN